MNQLFIWLNSWPGKAARASLTVCSVVLPAIFSLVWTDARGQRKCGIADEIAAMSAQHPDWAQKFAERKAAIQSVADNYKQLMATRPAERGTSAPSPVPVIFHIIVDSTHFNAMGGDLGITERVDSQIAVLNRDYNRQNADSTLIPSGWKPLYAATGIRFALAHTDPLGHSSPGFELLITGHAFMDGADYYSDAKTLPNGLSAWDNTRYLNVWCIAPADDPQLLGVTVPKSFTVSEGGYRNDWEEGCMVNCLALGCQTNTASLSFPSGGNYTEGRTLTHEIGHFFEIWHTWGDDNGLCPWYVAQSCPYGGGTGPGGTGSDDGLADTPPEGDAHYGNPAYTVTGGTVTDCCQYDGATNTQPFGVAVLSYLNYSDDDAMHMFTTDQAAAMASMVLVPPTSGIGATGSGNIGESYSLTQNPNLLEFPANTGVPAVIENSLSISPNPSGGIVNIAFDPATQLQSVIITDIMGREVAGVVPGATNGYYSIDLSAKVKGIYFIRCNFAAGSVTRKILLQ